MRKMESVLLGGILMLGIAVGNQVQAQTDCSFAAWEGGQDLTNAAVGTPKTTPAVARYSEFCGFSATGEGWVQTPATSDTRYFGRFYVLTAVTGTGEVDVLEAYSDTAGASPLFRISFDGADFHAHINSFGDDQTPEVTASGQLNRWNLVEFEFNANGDFNLWVNQEWTFPDGPYAGSPQTKTGLTNAGTVASVRMGAPNGMGGFGGSLSFDAFEAHRTTNVGAMIDCDADGNTAINLNDVISVINEAFSPFTLAGGQPDCDKNGAMNLNDVISTINVAFPPN